MLLDRESISEGRWKGYIFLCVEEIRLRSRCEAMLDDSMTSISVNNSVMITMEMMLIIVYVESYVDMWKT